MKTLGVIPARYSSNRFPGKPLADICGKPMIQYVYERSLKAKFLDKLVVATDDERIFDAVKKFNGNVVITSSHHKSGTDRIAEVAEKYDAEIIANVQGDEPLIEPQMIDSAIKPLLDDSSIYAGTLVKKIINEDELVNPNTAKVVIDIDGFAIYFSRSPIPYYRDIESKKEWIGKNDYYKHIGLYVFRKDFLLKFTKMSESNLEKIEKLEQLRIIENGYKIKVTVTEFSSIGVDTPEDLEVVRNIISRGSSLKK